MALTRLFLEPDLQFRLEAASYSEQLLKREDYAYSDISRVPAAYKDVEYSKKILPFVSIYPQLHGTSSEMNVTRLRQTAGMDISIAEPAFIRLQNFAAMSDWDSKDSIARKRFLRRLEYAHDEAAILLFQKEKEIISLLPKLIGIDMFNTIIEYTDVNIESRAIRVFRQKYRSIIDRLFYFFRKDLTGSILNSTHLESDLAFEGMKLSITEHPYFEALLTQMEGLYLRTVAEIFLCVDEQDEKTIVGPFGHLADRNIVRGDLVGQISRIDLPVKILPAPRSLREAVDFSHSKPIVRLRELMEVWEGALYQGNNKLENRIRRDIYRAQSEIRLLKWIRVYKDNPISVGVKFVGGFIPIVSSFVSVADVISFFGERKLTERSCWLNINIDAS